MAASFRCLQISQFCRPVIADGVRCFLRQRCLLFYHRFGLSYLARGRCASPTNVTTYPRHGVRNFLRLRENRLLTTGIGPDNTPQLSK